MVLGRRGSRSPVGSHLESVIRLQKRPVLVVPETFRRRHGSCLAQTAVRRAGKTDAVDRQPAPSGLTCHLVMVNGEASTLQDAQAILQEAGIVTAAQLLEDKSVTGALCRYADENGIDLTVMGAYGHSRLRRFFIGSHTTEMFSESRRALLMLR
jgi:nucleotide-binding universal stress UspA family protein